METKKILIVEDEAIVGYGMKATLEQRGYHITGIATSKKEALDCINEEEPDLILMDIGIEGPADGISTAKTIRNTYSDMPIVFITQFEDGDIFALAKEVLPRNYITKPFTDESLYRAVELALLETEHIKGEQVADSRYAFILCDDNKYKKLFVKNILCIEADGSYSYIHYVEDDQHHVFYVSISSNNVARQINNPVIQQVHKSYYINLEKIDYIQESVAYLKDYKDPVPIGRAYREKLYKQINILRSGGNQKK